MYFSLFLQSSVSTLINNEEAISLMKEFLYELRSNRRETVSLRQEVSSLRDEMRGKSSNSTSIRNEKNGEFHQQGLQKVTNEQEFEDNEEKLASRSSVDGIAFMKLLVISSSYCSCSFFILTYFVFFIIHLHRDQLSRRS